MLLLVLVLVAIAVVLAVLLGFGLGADNRSELARVQLDGLEAQRRIEAVARVAIRGLLDEADRRSQGR